MHGYLTRHLTAAELFGEGPPSSPPALPAGNFVGWFRAGARTPWREAGSADDEGDCWRGLLHHVRQIGLSNPELCVLARGKCPEDRPRARRY